MIMLIVRTVVTVALVAVTWFFGSLFWMLYSHYDTYSATDQSIARYIMWFVALLVLRCVWWLCKVALFGAAFRAFR